MGGPSFATSIVHFASACSRSSIRTELPRGAWRTASATTVRTARTSMPSSAQKRAPAPAGRAPTAARRRRALPQAARNGRRRARALHRGPPTASSRDAIVVGTREEQHAGDETREALVFFDRRLEDRAVLKRFASSASADLPTVEGTRTHLGTALPSSMVFMASKRVKSNPEIARHLATAFVRTPALHPRRASFDGMLRGVQRPGRYC